MKAIVLALVIMGTAFLPGLPANSLEKRIVPTGLSPCPASQETPEATGTVNVGVSCDNDFAVYLGTCCTVTNATFVGASSCNVTNACVRHGQAYTITGITGSSYLYIVAWSDSATAQGLLVSVGPGPVTSTPPSEILGGDPRWQVYATSLTFPGSPPTTTDNTTAPTKKFEKFLNAQLDIACSSNLWTTPTNGGTNASGNNVAGGGALEPPVTVVDPNALWMWLQSGKSACAGTQSPFSPGCNHNEYLIFRLPLSYIH